MHFWIALGQFAVAKLQSCDKRSNPLLFVQLSKVHKYYHKQKSVNSLRAFLPLLVIPLDRCFPFRKFLENNINKYAPMPKVQVKHNINEFSLII